MTYDQGDEADWVAERDHGLAVVHANELQLLRIRGADGNNHASTFAQLSEQSRWDFESGSGDQNCVEGSVGGKTECAVAGQDMDIGRTELGKDGARFGGEGGVPFDGEDLCGQFCQEGGNVPGAGADFENGVGRGESKRLQHDRDHVGLGDSLIIADGQRMILIGLLTQLLRDEFVAWNAQHGIEDAGIGDATGAELRVHHKLAGCGGVSHVSGFRLALRRFISSGGEREHRS